MRTESKLSSRGDHLYYISRLSNLAAYYKDDVNNVKVNGSYIDSPLYITMSSSTPSSLEALH